MLLSRSLCSESHLASASSSTAEPERGAPLGLPSLDSRRGLRARWASELQSWGFGVMGSDRGAAYPPSGLKSCAGRTVDRKSACDVRATSLSNCRQRGRRAWTREAEGGDITDRFWGCLLSGGQRSCAVCLQTIGCSGAHAYTVFTFYRHGSMVGEGGFVPTRGVFFSWRSKR